MLCDDWCGASHQSTNKTLPDVVLFCPVTIWPNDPVYNILQKFRKIYVCCNLWRSKFTPLEDEIYLRLRNAGVDRRC